MHNRTPPPVHTDEAIVNVYHEVVPSLIARSRYWGLPFADAEDLAQISMMAVVGARDTLDDGRDSLQRYALASYRNRRTDLFKSAWHRNTELYEPSAVPIDRITCTSAEDQYFAEEHARSVPRFFAALIDPERKLLSSDQRELLAAYLQHGTWREACKETGSATDHNAAKARGRRLTQKIAALVSEGRVERPQ